MCLGRTGAHRPRLLSRREPTLDPGETWEYSADVDAYASDPHQTTKTKKVMKNHVKAEATDKHPAQVEVYHEDVVVGFWTKVTFSGAVPQKRVNELLERIGRLQNAVKFAREEANGTEITYQRVGEKVLGYLLG